MKGGRPDQKRLVLKKRLRLKRRRDVANFLEGDTALSASRLPLVRFKSSIKRSLKPDREVPERTRNDERDTTVARTAHQSAETSRVGGTIAEVSFC